MLFPSSEDIKKNMDSAPKEALLQTQVKPEVFNWAQHYIFDIKGSIGKEALLKRIQAYATFQYGNPREAWQSASDETWFTHEEAIAMCVLTGIYPSSFAEPGGYFETGKMTFKQRMDVEKLFRDKTEKRNEIISKMTGLIEEYYSNHK